MTKQYEVVCLDHDRYDLVRDIVGSLKEGRVRARQLLLDLENIKEGAKIEIIDSNGDCIADYFFP